MDPIRPDPSLEELATAVLHCALRVYHDLGPGLLESVYERLLLRQLVRSGLAVQRQCPVEFTYDGETFQDAFRVDLLVEQRLVVEVKAVETLPPVAIRQSVTYLRLLGLPLALLINFGAPRFHVRRVVNQHQDTRGSRLRIHRFDA
jgi:GxxExxY protein